MSSKGVRTIDEGKAHRVSSAGIRSFRERLSLSQRAFGAAIGVPQMTVYRWEAGISVPNLSNLFMMEELAIRRNVPFPFFAGSQQPVSDSSLRSEPLQEIAAALSLAAVRLAQVSTHRESEATPLETSIERGTEGPPTLGIDLVRIELAAIACEKQINRVDRFHKLLCEHHPLSRLLTPILIEAEFSDPLVLLYGSDSSLIAKVGPDHPEALRSLSELAAKFLLHAKAVAAMHELLEDPPVAHDAKAAISTSALHAWKEAGGRGDYDLLSATLRACWRATRLRSTAAAVLMKDAKPLRDFEEDEFDAWLTGMRQAALGEIRFQVASCLEQLASYALEAYSYHQRSSLNSFMQQFSSGLQSRSPGLEEIALILGTRLARDSLNELAKHEQLTPRDEMERIVRDLAKRVLLRLTGENQASGDNATQSQAS